jgi:hypothetical protein
METLECLKLNGTHQLLVYVDAVNILGGSIHSTEKKSVAVVIPSKERGPEVNAEKTKYVVVSGDQNAGQDEKINIGNKFFSKV